MELITSKENEKIKYIKKLKGKKYRDEEEKYIIEGIKLIEEAISEKVQIETIVICDDCAKCENIPQKLLYEIAKYDCIYVVEKIFNILSDVSTHQGILAVIKRTNETKIDYNEEMILVLDDIQDPGNLGTIIRTLDSTGLKQIILSKNCADPYSLKVVRATMGGIYRVNIIRSENIIKTLESLKEQKYEIVTTELFAEDTIYDLSYKKQAIVIGNEANGVEKDVLEFAQKKVSIPMFGKTESLNASVAAGIILYEYVRKNKLLT